MPKMGVPHPDLFTAPRWKDPGRGVKKAGNQRVAVVYLNHCIRSSSCPLFIVYPIYITIITGNTKRLI